jgi:Immunity protein Imm1/SCP1.201-like deaminase
VHPAGAVLDEHQDVQPFQQHGVDVQEVDGEDPGGLRVQELPPGRSSDLEQKFGTIMIRNGIPQASLLINNPNGPCEQELGCANVLGTILGPDRTLTVYWPSPGRGFPLQRRYSEEAAFEGLDTERRELMRPSIEARYWKGHVKEPVKLSTVEDVDVLINALLVSTVDQNLAQLHSLLRPLLPSGYHDHELMVGVDGGRRVGVLAFMDSSGNVVTLDSPEYYRYKEVAYCEMGHRREFPNNSEIPVGLVRRAVKEFLVSGGQRPECVQWQMPEFWLFRTQVPMLVRSAGLWHDSALSYDLAVWEGERLVDDAAALSRPRSGPASATGSPPSARPW